MGTHPHRMHYVVGILGCVAGFFYLKYSDKIANTFGSVGFAERYLGAGGTFTLHKIIGLLTIVLSVLYMFGSLQAIIRGTLGKFV